MKLCWAQVAAERPSLNSIKEQIENFEILSMSKNKSHLRKVGNNSPLKESILARNSYPLAKRKLDFNDDHSSASLSNGTRKSQKTSHKILLERRVDPIQQLIPMDDSDSDNDDNSHGSQDSLISQLTRMRPKEKEPTPSQNRTPSSSRPHPSPYLNPSSNGSKYLFLQQQSRGASMTHDTDLEKQQEEEGNVQDEPPEHDNDDKASHLGNYL
ncbi:hypothetical protein OUZ56_011380 [Daphnia magna]|uniref:Serine-threonine/tyrosine-protein kinase catalytic domain-containing protein n=1 Tax=Daphnia magna TaxID=35525 RepID=A0ABQ9Z002_9CRUS|nr:hypothetical protein OUZ56_011380 [Daphnia magna]